MLAFVGVGRSPVIYILIHYAIFWGAWPLGGNLYILDLITAANRQLFLYISLVASRGDSVDVMMNPYEIASICTLA